MSETIQYISKDISKESLLSKIDHMYQLYEKNEYILQKMDHYITTTLPCLLSNAAYQQNQRLICKKNDESFMESFLRDLMQNITVYYIPIFESFFLYENEKCKKIDEDDLLHKLLQSLSNLDISSTLKHKTKHYVIKKIKEVSLGLFIPESKMIQNVLDLFVGYFESKNATKYFFTIIGDLILKKNTNLFYFVPLFSKKFMKEISQCSLSIFQNDFLSSHFKYKYHDSFQLSNLRMICFHKHGHAHNNLFHFHDSLFHSFFEFIFVCVHYSQRYHSSDEYLQCKSYDTSLYNYSFYFKNHLINDMITEFIIDTFDFVKQSTLSSLCIPFKNVHFFWKQYLEERHIPVFLYQNELKDHIKKTITYDEQNDVFLGITTKRLLSVNQFLQFWDDTINEDLEMDYDIDELVSLYQQWNQKVKSVPSLCETQMIELISHFYSNIVIENNKHILGISCSLWNKKDSIHEFMKNYILNNKEESCSILQLYSNYCDYCGKIKRMIVNKDTFEREIQKQYSEQMIDNIILFSNS